MNEDFQRQFPPELQGRPSYDKETLNYSAEDHHVWSNQKKYSEVRESLNCINKFNFPESFIDHISTELMISNQQAEDLVFEYKRFILIEGMTNYKLYPSEIIEKVWCIHMGYSLNYISFCRIIPDNSFAYHLPFTGNSRGFNDVDCYTSTLNIYKIIFKEDPPTCAWPPVEIRLHPENFNCVYINLVRLAGMYNVYQQGLLVYTPPTQIAVPVQSVVVSNSVSIERQEIIKAKHEERMQQRSYSSNDNVFFCPGGLIYVDNPYYFNYNNHFMFLALAEGLHDGLSLLPDIHFEDVLDLGIGDLGGLADLSIPDINFDGLGDIVGFSGDVIGGAINIGGDAAGFVGEVGGDVVNFAGGAAGAVGDAIGNADIGGGLADFGEGILNVGKEIFEGIGNIAGSIFDLLDAIK